MTMDEKADHAARIARVLYELTALMNDGAKAGLIIRFPEWRHRSEMVAIPKQDVTRELVVGIHLVGFGVLIDPLDETR